MGAGSKVKKRGAGPRLGVVATKVEETGQIAISKAEQDLKNLLQLSLEPIPELAAGAVDAAQQDVEALAEAQRSAIIKRYSYGAELCALVDDEHIKKAGEMVKKKIEEYGAGNMEALETLRDLDMYVASIILFRHTEGGLPESAEYMRALAKLNPEDILEREKHLDAILGAEMEVPLIQLEQKKSWLAQIAAQYEGGMVNTGSIRMGELLAEATELKKKVLEEQDEEKRGEAYAQFVDTLEYAQSVFTLSVSFNSQLERAEALDKKIAELGETAKKLEENAEKPKNAKMREKLLASAETIRNQVALLEAARALIPEAGKETAGAIASRKGFEGGAGRARHLISYSGFLESQAEHPAQIAPGLVAAAGEIAKTPEKVLLEKEKYDSTRLLHSTVLAAEMQIGDAHATLERVGENKVLEGAHKKEVEGWVSDAIGGLQKALELLRKEGATKKDIELARQEIWLAMVKIENAKELVSGLEEAGVAEFAKSLQEREAARKTSPKLKRWDSAGETKEKTFREQKAFLDEMVGRAIRKYSKSHALAEAEMRETGEKAEEISLRRIAALDAATLAMEGIGTYARAQETLEHAKKNFLGNGLSPWEDRALTQKERKQKDEGAKLAHIDSVRSAIAQIENGLMRISGGEKEEALSNEEIVSANSSILRAGERIETLRALQEVSSLEHRIRGFAPGKQYTRTLWDAAQKARKALEGKENWKNASVEKRRNAAQRYLKLANEYSGQFLASTWRNCRMRADGTINPSTSLPEIERDVKKRGERKVLPSELARKHTGRALRAMVAGEGDIGVRRELNKGQTYAQKARNGYSRIASLGISAAGSRVPTELGEGEIPGALQENAAKVDAESRKYEQAVWAYEAGEIGSGELSASKRKVETAIASLGKGREEAILLANARQEGEQIAGEILRLDGQDAEQGNILSRAESALLGLYGGETSLSKRGERKKNADAETKERIKVLETQIQLAKATKEQIALQVGKLQTRQMQLGTVLGQAEVAEKIEKRRELGKESARLWGKVAETEQEIDAAEGRIREIEAEITALDFQEPGVPGHLAASAQSKKAGLQGRKRELEKLKEKRLAQRQEIVENERRIAELPDNFEFREIDDPENVEIALRNARNERELADAEAPNIELAGKYGGFVVAAIENDQAAKGSTPGIIRGRDALRDPRARTELSMVRKYQEAAHLAVFGGRRFMGDESIDSRLKEYRAPQGSAEERRGKAIPEGREANEGMQGVTSLYAARVSPTDYSDYAPVATALNESDRAIFEKPPAMPSPDASETEWVRYEENLNAYHERREKAGMVAEVVLAANSASASAGTWVAGRAALASQVASARATLLGTMDWESLGREQIASNLHEIERRAHTIARINDMAGYGELSTLVIELATPVGWALIVAKMAGGALEQMAQTGELPLGTLGEIALMESGKLGMVMRFGRAAESIAWARRAVPKMATAGQKARAFSSVAGDIAFNATQLGTVVYFTGAAATGAYHGMQEVQETGMGLSHVISQTVFTLLPLKGPIMGAYARGKARRTSEAYQRQSVKRHEAQAAEAKARGAYLEMERGMEAARTESTLKSRSLARAKEKLAERLGLERPTVVVDMGKALPPQPVPVRRAAPAEAERPPSFDAYFHGKKAELVDGKIRYLYTLQEGVAPKTFSEMQVREMEQAVFYAEKIVRGELVEIPARIRGMAERLSVEEGFVKAVETLDIVSKAEGSRDARALSSYTRASRESQFRLAVEAFEKERMPEIYEAERAAAERKQSALGEVEGALRKVPGEKISIEMEFGEWRNEFEPGEIVQVHIPREGGGLRAENVRIEDVAPATAGLFIITYTVESTGSTGMVAVPRKAGGIDAHNALAANVLGNIRKFEAPVAVPAAPAMQARAFGDFWRNVEQNKAVVGEKFLVDVQGKKVEATLDRVHKTPGDATILNFTAEGRKFTATLGKGVREADVELIIRSKIRAPETVGAPSVRETGPAEAESAMREFIRDRDRLASHEDLYMKYRGAGPELEKLPARTPEMGEHRGEFDYAVDMLNKGFLDTNKEVREMGGLSKGWLLYEVGEVGALGRDFADRVRFPINLRNAGAAREFAKLFVNEIRKTDAPVGFKTTDNPEVYGMRLDNTVVYARKENAGQVMDVLLKINSEHPELFNEGVPPLLKKIGKGIGAAEESVATRPIPNSTRTEPVSFGTHRTRAVFNALEKARKAGINDEAAILKMMREEFVAEGITPDKPYLNAGSEDFFVLPGEEAAARKAAPRERELLPKGIEKPAKEMEASATERLRRMEDEAYRETDDVDLERELKKVDDPRIDLVARTLKNKDIRVIGPLSEEYHKALLEVERKGGTDEAVVEEAEKIVKRRDGQQETKNTEKLEKMEKSYDDTAGYKPRIDETSPYFQPFEKYLEAQKIPNPEVRRVARTLQEMVEFWGGLTEVGRENLTPEYYEAYRDVLRAGGTNEAILKTAKEMVAKRHPEGERAGALAGKGPETVGAPAAEARRAPLMPEPKQFAKTTKPAPVPEGLGMKPPAERVGEAPAIKPAHPFEVLSPRPANEAQVAEYKKAMEARVEPGMLEARVEGFREQMGEIESRVASIAGRIEPGRRLEFVRLWDSVVENSLRAAEREGAKTKGDTLAVEYDKSLNLLDSLSARLEVLGAEGSHKPIALLKAYESMGPGKARQLMLLSSQAGGVMAGKLSFTPVERTVVAESVVEACREGGSAREAAARVIESLEDGVLLERLGMGKEGLLQLLKEGKTGEAIRQINGLLAEKGVALSIIGDALVPAYVTNIVRRGWAEAFFVERVPGMADPLSGAKAEFHRETKQIYLKGGETKEVLHELDHYAQFMSGFYDSASGVVQLEAVAIANSLGFSRISAGELLREMRIWQAGEGGLVYADAAKMILNSRPSENHYSLAEILERAGVVPKDRAPEIQKKLEAWARREMPGKTDAEMGVILESMVKSRLVEFVDAEYELMVGISYTDIFNPVPLDALRGERAERLPWKGEPAPAGSLQQKLGRLGVADAGTVSKIQETLGAKALEERANALLRTFRGMEGVGREVVEGSPELFSMPQAEFEANVRRLRETRRVIEKIARNAEKHGIPLMEGMEKDARPYLDTEFKSNLLLGIYRKMLEQYRGPERVQAPQVRPRGREAETSEKFRAQIEDALRIEDGGERAKTLSYIAIDQAKVGSFEEAGKTISLIPSEKKFNRERVDALAFLAGKQAEAGNFTDALANVERISALKMALRYKNEEIESEFTKERYGALKQIASEQAKAGKFKDAIRTAEKIEEGSYERSEAFALVSSEQANAGSFGEATKTILLIPEKFKKERAGAFAFLASRQADARKFKDAVRTAGDISEKEFPEASADAFAYIAVQQAKAGIDPLPLFSKAEKITREGYGTLDGAHSKALALARLARYRSEAGLDPSPLFKEARNSVTTFPFTHYRPNEIPVVLSEIAVEMERAGLDPRPIFAEAKEAAGKIRGKRREMMQSELAAKESEETALMKIAVNEAKAGLFMDAMETWSGLSRERALGEEMIPAVEERIAGLPAEKVAGEAEKAAEALFKYGSPPYIVSRFYRVAWSAETNPAKKLALEKKAIITSIFGDEPSWEYLLESGENARARHEALFSLWDKMGNRMDTGGVEFLKGALPKLHPENIDASFGKLRPLLETYDAIQRELGPDVSKGVAPLFRVVDAEPATTELLLSQIGAKEKSELGVEKLAFYFLSLGETKPGDGRAYREIIFSLPEAKRGEAMKRFLTRMSKEYEAQKATRFMGGPLQPKMAASTIIVSSDVAQMIDLAESLGIKGKTPMEILGGLDAAIRKSYSEDIPPSLREVTFSAKEIIRSLPGEYEKTLRGVLGNAIASGKERAASAMEKAMPLLELSMQIREGGLSPDVLKALEGKVPEGLLKAGNAENVLQYLAKHQKDLGTEGNLALVGEVLKSAGIEELAARYARGETLSAEERGLLYTKLSEITRYAEDWARDMLPKGDWQTLREIVARTKEYSVLKQIKNELYVKEASEKASEKNIQLVFGPKTIQHLGLGRIAGTCFGDYVSILLPKDVIVVPILEGGEAKGNLLFLLREIDGKKSLVMFGFDPSESMVIGLTEGKRFELADRIMEQVISYCRENGFELYATKDGGGLSNREELEPYITTAYFDFRGTLFGAGDAAKKVDPITLHPDYKYKIEHAYPLIPERRGIWAKPKAPEATAAREAGTLRPWPPAGRRGPERVQAPQVRPRATPVPGTPAAPGQLPGQQARPARKAPVEEQVSLDRMEQLARMADRVVYEGKPEPPMLSAKERVAFERLREGAKQDKAAGTKRLSEGELVKAYARDLLLTEFGSQVEKSRYLQSIKPSQDYDGRMVEVWRNLEKIFVLGDGHGDFKSVFDLLESTGVVRKKASLPDATYRAFDPAARKGRTMAEKFMEHLNGAYEITLKEGEHVVFLGDYFDRGDTSMELFGAARWLRAKAQEKGAVVHMLRSNHEELLLECYNHFEKMSTAEMNSLITQAETFESALQSRKVDLIADLIIQGYPPQKAAGMAENMAFRELLLSGNYPEFKRIFDAGLYLPSIGIVGTLESMSKWYGEGFKDATWWEKAKAGLAADGTLAAISKLKAVVILDNYYFAHGGMNANLTDVESIDGYYTNLFSGKTTNHWRSNVIRNPDVLNYDTGYVGKEWFGDSPGIELWRNEMAGRLGLDSLDVVVGHSGGGELREAGSGILCADTRISEAYGGTGEALVLTPMGALGIRAPGKGRQAAAPSLPGTRGLTWAEPVSNEISQADAIPIALVPPARVRAPQLNEFSQRKAIAEGAGYEWHERMDREISKKASEMGISIDVLFDAYIRYAGSTQKSSWAQLQEFCNYAAYERPVASKLHKNIRRTALEVVKFVENAKKDAEREALEPKPEPQIEVPVKPAPAEPIAAKPPGPEEMAGERAPRRQVGEEPVPDESSRREWISMMYPEPKPREVMRDLSISAPGEEMQGAVFYGLREGELMPGEHSKIKEVIRLKLKENPKTEPVLYLQEGYIEGRPFVNIMGRPFSSLKNPTPEAFTVFVKDGKVFAPKELLREIDYEKFGNAEGRIILLSPTYIIGIYERKQLFSYELELIKERFPDAEIHIPKREYEQVKRRMREEGLGEELEALESLRKEGKFTVEDMGLKHGEDAYRAYLDAFGEAYAVAPIDFISSYRKIAPPVWSVGEEQVPLSRKEIPLESVPVNEVQVVLQAMGFERASNNPNHGNYNRWQRTVDGNLQHVDMRLKDPSVHVTYLSRELLRFTSRREFARTFREEFGRKYRREYGQVGVRVPKGPAVAAAPEIKEPHAREGMPPELTNEEKMQVDAIARKGLRIGMPEGMIRKAREKAYEAGSGKAIGSMEDSIKAYLSLVRVAKLNAAKGQRTLGQKAEQERKALEAIGRRDISTGYNGGSQAQLDALEKMGVKMLDARECLQKISDVAEIKNALDSGNPNEIFRAAKKHGIEATALIEAGSELRILGRVLENRITEIRENLPRQMEDAFGLVVRGGLQEKINSIPEYSGYQITSMKKLGGMRGIFEVRIEKEGKGRNLYVKLEDVEPSLLGKELAEAAGLLASNVYIGYKYPTGIEIDGKPAMQNFGIIEDIRDFAGRSANIRVPTGKVDAQGREVTQIEEVQVLGAVDLHKELLSKPDSEHPVHVAFYRMLSTPGGRIELFRAWNRYHEMSRGVLLADRFPRNTAVVLVKRAGSEEPVITFQPIDMDSVAIFGSKPDGTPDFGLMHVDYRCATEAFIADLSTVSRNNVMGEAAPDGLGFGPETPLEFGGLAGEFRQAMPASPYELPTLAVAEIFKRYEGKPYGSGSDATDPNSTGNKLGTTARQGGNANSFVINEDGRFTLRSGELVPLLGAARRNFGEFWEEMGRVSLHQP